MEITAAGMVDIAIIKNNYADHEAMPDALNYQSQQDISLYSGPEKTGSLGAFLVIYFSIDAI